jgi:hypothetical protein
MLMPHPETTEPSVMGGVTAEMQWLGQRSVARSGKRKGAEARAHVLGQVAPPSSTARERRLLAQ